MDPVTGAAFLYKFTKASLKLAEVINPNHIYVKNSSSVDIYVAVRYNTDGLWKTTSWHKVSSGEKAHIIKTKLSHRNLYFHAYSTDGNYVWQGDDYAEEIDGKIHKFFMRDSHKNLSAIYTQEIVLTS